MGIKTNPICPYAQLHTNCVQVSCAYEMWALSLVEEHELPGLMCLALFCFVLLFCSTRPVTSIQLIESDESVFKSNLPCEFRKSFLVLPH